MNWQDVSFESAVLVGANFEHSEIERLNLTMANLACATLSHVDLRGSAMIFFSFSFQPLIYIFILKISRSLFGGGKGNDVGAANLSNADLASSQLQVVKCLYVCFVFKL